MTEHDGHCRPDAAAFWNINVDPSQQTIDCPDFLRYCFDNEKDRKIISTPDREYHVLTWTEVRKLCEQGRPDLFQRIPSELRRYRQFCIQLEGRYGSVLDFIMKERLRWKDTVARSEGFTDPDDYKILFNDWPYGVDPNIVHLVVWTKFAMPEDPHTGLLFPIMQAKVERFIDEKFNATCGKENVTWFRNWVSLKSVHAVEHFHIMLFKPGKRFLDALTDGDQPLAVRLGCRRR